MACSAIKVPKTVPVTSRWDLLPDDLQEFILQIVKEKMQKKKKKPPPVPSPTAWVRFSKDFGARIRAAVIAECETNPEIKAMRDRIVAARFGANGGNGYGIRTRVNNERFFAMARETWCITMTPNERFRYYLEHDERRSELDPTFEVRSEEELEKAATFGAGAAESCAHRRAELLEVLGSAEAVQRYMTVP